MENMFFRSIKNLGGTRARAKNKIMALGGMGHNAICVELMERSVVANCDFNAQRIRDYKKCKDAKELANLP